MGIATKRPRAVMRGVGADSEGYESLLLLDGISIQNLEQLFRKAKIVVEKAGSDTTTFQHILALMIVYV
jgi:hypothetical protein